MEQALPVEIVPFDETVELTGDVSEMSVEQYLSWVRTQSNRLPTVFRANHLVSSSVPSIQQTKYMPEVEAIPHCPESFQPSEEWERNTLYTFSELRLSLAAKSESSTHNRVINVPAMKDRAAWIAFCLNIDLYPPKSVVDQDNSLCAGTVEDADISIKKRKRALAETLGIEMDMEEDEENAAESANMDVIPAEADIEGLGDEGEEDEEEVEGHSGRNEWQGERGAHPSVPLLLQLDQVLTQRVLLILIDYIEEYSLSNHASEWVYALLSRVEKPLHRDVVAALRQLFRRCCKLRSMLITANEALADESKDAQFEENLAALNLIIVITGNYFGQNEAIKEYFSDAVITQKEGHGTSENLMEGDNDDDDDYDEGSVDENAGYDGGVFQRPAKMSRFG